MHISLYFLLFLLFFFRGCGHHRDLHYPLRRQRQMCIRDRWYISTINSHFLGGCKSLVEVDLTALVHVKLFRPNFLDGCESLVSVTFPPLFKTTTDTNPIGICSSFMAGCSKINHLDMRPLGRYIEVKYDCKHIFRGCKELLKNNKKKSGEIGIADCGVLYADKVAMKAVKGGMRGDPAKEWEPPEFLSCVVC
eukprot:TRINITY_DN51199_c0_g1_i1.p1 TRINITY_DN51199_c0_g1~~TRINITY_DN51199_c0_g1_i1.p1  ORF type:complete len:193 (+),score=10.80 TRINITY_DN51199_c0_g1_i1:3-581(+)